MSDARPTRVWAAALLLLLLLLRGPAVATALWQNGGSVRLNWALHAGPTAAAPADLARAAAAFDHAGARAGYQQTLLAVWLPDMALGPASAADQAAAGQMLSQLAAQLAERRQYSLLSAWYERGAAQGLPLTDYWPSAAAAFAAVGDWPAAAIAAEQATIADPRRQANWYALGRAYVESGAYDRARPALAQALALPDDGSGRSNILYLLGLTDAYGTPADLAAARTRFQQALELDDYGPSDHRTSTLFQLGATYTLAEEWAIAAGYYQAVLDRVPDHYQAHVHLARAYWRQGDDAAAIALCRAALDLAPAEADAYLLLGDIYLAQGDDAAAQAVFAAGLAQQPDNAALQARRP